ncbi:zinc finger B-box domain-containing protein 1-like [Nelusetta ayraudi]|uniref:zinc finger B-box domain-containing protein 1-like n=1 Tax=Nelusetta ayraudi TaxID=303726 RepID=UPI003F71D6DD
MNLNEFVVLPNSKAKSVKLNARNLHQLQMHTVTLAQEQRSMEENLQQLKETMSKQKEERSNSAGFRWKSGQRASLKNVSSTKKSLEDRVQKLLAGREKIRVLKAETKKAPPPPAKQRGVEGNGSRETLINGNM